MDPKKIVFSISFLLLITSCNLKGLEVYEMKFCPPEIEKEAKEVLGIESYKISLNVLLDRLDERGIDYEESSIDSEPLNCKEYLKLENSISYKVYAGYDEKNEFVRSYLVVFDEDRMLRYIDKRYMYHSL